MVDGPYKFCRRLGRRDYLVRERHLKAAEGEGSRPTLRSITVERRWRGETSVKITEMEENKETPSSLMKWRRTRKRD